MLRGLIFLPVAGALLVALLPARCADLRWRFATAVALAALALAGIIAASYDPAGPLFQMNESQAWNVRLGSYFALGVDGLAVAMLLLTALLGSVALLASRTLGAASRLYFPLLLLLESALFGVFCARDWSLFYVFWEATLIPLFFLIDRLGGSRRQHAALNFFLYTLAGSVFMLVALLFLYDAAPGHSFAMTDMASGGAQLAVTTQTLIFAGLFIGFGVKMPVVPLHAWLPLAHVEAPSPISILLSGVLLKMGAYGLIRASETLPGALPALQWPLALLACLTLAYGAVLAWRQQDMKGMVAYASISHMGLVLLGVAAMTAAALRGAIVQMVAHGLTAGLLFLLVGLLYQRTHQRDLAAYTSLLAGAPRCARLLAFALLAGIGLPGSAGFIAEVHILFGGIERWGAVALLASLGMLITAAYSLRVIRRLCLPGTPMAVTDLSRPEFIAAALLAGAIVLLGLWPAPLLDLIDGSVAALVRQPGWLP